MTQVGLVVVSHSRALAEAAVELALIMVHGDKPPLEIAAGTDDGGFGTDAVAVMEAIMSANQGAGVAVFVDLGSALTSTDMALEMLSDMGEDIETRVVAAPFVEGLTAAVVRAATGESLDVVAGEAEGSLDMKLQLLGKTASTPTGGDGEGASVGVGSPEAPPATPDATGEVQVVNRMGLHARPVAEIAALAGKFPGEITLETSRGHANAKSPISLAILAAACGETVRISASGEQAEAAVTAITELIASGFGEERGVASVGSRGASTTVSTDSESAPRRRLGVSPGRALGVVVKLQAQVDSPEAKHITPEQTTAETQRLQAAIESAVSAYQKQAADSSDSAQAILQATAALAADPDLAARAIALIQTEKIAAEAAWWQAASDFASELRRAGGIIAERATDLGDIRVKVLARLQGKDVDTAGFLKGIKQPFVLVAKDLAPSDTAVLPETKAVAIVTTEGGPTSHTSLLARAMGIPAVIGAYISELETGAKLLVDGDTGELLMNPNAKQSRGARTGPAALVKLEAPGATKDEVHIELLANIGDPAEAATAAAAGAEGIGLFRTEFAYLGKPTEPSVSAQAEAYARVYAAFAESAHPHVTIRTLDAGSDKPLQFLPLPVEPNPALGVRGYRTAQLFPDVLKRQLEAIAAGAPDAWVMAPMISLPAEAQAFAELARGFGIKKVGVMIETPAAALAAREIYQAVDFVSLGTNDLAQYTFAADRESNELSALNNPRNAALLRLISQVGKAATAAGKPLGVCGEAAGSAKLAPILVGLGVTSLSMNPRQLAEVSKVLRAHTFRGCKTMATRALK